MKNSSLVIWLIISIILLIPTANAELFDRGNGLIYDSDQDLTWMQNADVNGKMSVQNAMIWVENLVYEGFDDWRIPTTLQYDDPSCLEDTRHIGFAIFYERHTGCTGGEMEQLTATADPYRNPMFNNVRDSRYWTSTPYRNGIDPCVEGDFCTKVPDNGIRNGFFWQWDFRKLFKTTLAGGNSRYVWAVRDGDVDGTTSTAPPPAPVDPEIAIGQITTNIYVPSFDDGTDNIWVKFVYYGITPEGENIWELQETGVNSPAIVDNPNTGTTVSDTQIHLPSVDYNGLDANRNIWIDLIKHTELDENGDPLPLSLWTIGNYGDN